MSMEEKKVDAVNEAQTENTQLALDDERRVKVLSPGALVAKRFFRNRLAMVGLCILVAMFLFSFVGALITPYGETQIFEEYTYVLKDYASATENTEYRFVEPEDGGVPAAARTALILAVKNGETSFTSGDQNYTLTDLGKGTWLISGTQQVAKADKLAGMYAVTATKDGFTVEPALIDAFSKAADAGQTEFTVGGETYYVAGAGRSYTISAAKELGVGSTMVFTGEGSYEMKKAAYTAFGKDETSFEADGKSYTLEIAEKKADLLENGAKIGELNAYSVQTVEVGAAMPDELKERIIAAVENGETGFVLGDVEYEVTRENTRYTIRTETSTKIIQTYLAPSKIHLLGTDGYGMDILTRLMHGGQISLIIGFVVVILELIIGVVLGGLAGYFGGWTDMLIMRVVDIFNCIPTWPILIIFGSIMDNYKVDPQIRIYFMMIVLAALGWTGITRMVRGQILSLREQEFMTAAEASGLSVSRRIFKHLVPNVIPQLVVQCTMALGGIILTESTMSFLGIGVKFPYASWGNIISSVSNVFVMTNYWYCWIPAGMLILLTVLGFNFVGDGLRDAFDPKMKR